MTLKIKGELEVDSARGVVYFHSEHGYTALRICHLPIPIPNPKPGEPLDITHLIGCNWRSTK